MAAPRWRCLALVVLGALVAADAASEPGRRRVEPLTRAAPAGRRAKSRGGAPRGGQKEESWDQTPTKASTKAVLKPVVQQGRMNVQAKRAPSLAEGLGIKYPIVKLLLFLYYGSLGALFPFLPMFYKALGYSGKRVGQLGAITPAAAFVTSALWGALADKTGNLKGILLLTFLCATLVRMCQPLTSNFTAQVVIVAISAVLNAPVRPLLDSSVIGLLDDKQEYGKQRLFGQVGFGVGSYLMGPYLRKSASSFHAAFYVHGAVSLCLVLPVMLRFTPRKQERESPRFREGIRLILHKPQALMFFTLVFIIGLSSGVTENFAYIRVQQVGGTGRQLGLLRAASSVAGMPMFWFSGQLTSAVGVMGVLLWAVMSYILRLLIYAQMTSPWMALPAEVLRGGTFAAMWAASTYYANHIAPPGMRSTMIAFLNAMYQGLGQSTGALVGGALVESTGTIQNAYRVMAGLDCVAFAICSIVLLRNRHFNEGMTREKDSDQKTTQAR